MGDDILGNCVTHYLVYQAEVLTGLDWAFVDDNLGLVGWTTERRDSVGLASFGWGLTFQDHTLSLPLNSVVTC